MKLGAETARKSDQALFNQLRLPKPLLCGGNDLHSRHLRVSVRRLKDIEGGTARNSSDDQEGTRDPLRVVAPAAILPPPLSSSSAILHPPGAQTAANSKRVQDSRYGVFPCEDCGKVYTWKRNLVQHRRFECGKEPQFQCPYCNHRASQKQNLKTHIARRH